MSEPREYRMLSDWYEDLAAEWAAFVPILRGKMQDALHWDATASARCYVELARQCTLRAARYARLAEKAKAQNQADMTNVTPIKVENQ